MSTRVPIGPNGKFGHAILRDASELRARDQRLVKAAAMAAASVFRKLGGVFEPEADESPEQRRDRIRRATEAVDLTPTECDRMLGLKEATLVALLADWDRPEPVPTADTVGDLPPDLYDALIALVDDEEVAEQAHGADVDFGNPQDPEGPTGPSSPSDGHLRDAEESTSTPPSLSGGESSSTDASTAASPTSST